MAKSKKSKSKSTKKSELLYASPDEYFANQFGAQSPYINNRKAGYYILKDIVDRQQPEGPQAVKSVPTAPKRKVVRVKRSIAGGAPTLQSTGWMRPHVGSTKQLGDCSCKVGKDGRWHCWKQSIKTKTTRRFRGGCKLPADMKVR